MLVVDWVIVDMLFIIKQLIQNRWGNNKTIKYIPSSTIIGSRSPQTAILCSVMSIPTPNVHSATPTIINKFKNIIFNFHPSTTTNTISISWGSGCNLTICRHVGKIMLMAIIISRRLFTQLSISSIIRWKICVRLCIKDCCMRRKWIWGWNK